MMEQFTVEVQSSNGDRYSVPDIYAANWPEALWIAYGRALISEASHQPHLDGPYRLWRQR